MHDTPQTVTAPMTTPEAARYTGLSRTTLETLRIRGGGPKYLKLGRRVVYRRVDLDEWLAGRVVSSTSDAAARGIGTPLVGLDAE